MKIYEFISKYCQDLVESHNLRKEMFDLTDFVHDDVIIDIEGNKIPIVYVDNEQVPISDILTMTRDDFVKTYKMQSAGTVYDNYIATLEMLEGEDALNAIRNSIRNEKKRLEEDADNWMMTI